MGNMALFSGKTDLVVGPGFKETFLNTTDPSPLGAVIPSDVEYVPALTLS